MTRVDKNIQGSENLQADLEEEIIQVKQDIENRKATLEQPQEDVKDLSQLVELLKTLGKELTVENFANVYRHIQETGKPEYMADFWGYSKLSQEVYHSYTDPMNQKESREHILAIAKANFEYLLTGNTQPLENLKNYKIQTETSAAQRKPEPLKGGNKPLTTSPNPLGKPKDTPRGRNRG